MQKTRIVVLDGFTANPGDLDWRSLAGLGELTVHDRTPATDVVSRARDAAVLLTNKTLLHAEALRQLPALRCISVLATGYNVVDVAAARSRGVMVCNVPGYSTPSVVQHTLALLLELANQAGLHARLVREGAWTESADFAFWRTPLVELHGRTLGIVGFGAIGRGVAVAAQALGMRVLVTSRRRPANLPEGVTWAELEPLLRESDVVSLHCPLTPETRHLINARTLGLLKPTAFVLNTGRGPLVDEVALADALHAGQLAGAAVDVLSSEPPAADNPLIQAPNCIITPHQAWATAAARRRLLEESASNVRAFLAGTPRNVVS